MVVTFQLRLKIYMRDSFTCRYCHLPMNPLSDDLTLDHVDPDGPDAEPNLVTACRQCNVKKHRTSAEEFAARLAAEAAHKQSTGAVTLEQILAHTAVALSVSRGAILGRGRTRSLVNARAYVSQEARKSGFTSPEIGRFLGLHHTSVLYLISRPVTGLPSEPSEPRT